MPRRPKTSDSYRCANPACERRLLISGYSVGQILPGVSAERIHRAAESWTPGFTLLCTCGHYTVVTRWRPNPV